MKKFHKDATVIRKKQKRRNGARSPSKKLKFGWELEKERKMKENRLKIMTVYIVAMATTVIAFIIAVMAFTLGCGGAKESISISNKDALTAAWVEGEADRTIEIAFTPDKYTTENTDVTVESSNADAIKAEGLTLKAVGGGKATITVKARGLSDSVEIQVTPQLKNVTISNKDDLGKQWVVGDEDRTVALDFGSDYYNVENTGATIVSDNTEVVSVSGTSIHAVAAGTAKITVTARDFSDEVTVLVRPNIESLTLSNKTELEEDWAIGTERVIAPQMTPVDYTVENTVPTVTCEPAGIVELVEGWRIKAKAVGTATVAVAVCGKTETFTVNVKHVAPVLSIKGAGEEMENGL